MIHIILLACHEVKTIIKVIAIQLYYNTLSYRIVLVIKVEIELNIQQLLDKNGRTKYWLVKKLETDYRFATKLLENETKSISFHMIGKLCHIFDCTPNELFSIKNQDDKTG